LDGGFQTTGSSDRLSGFDPFRTKSQGIWPPQTGQQISRRMTFRGTAPGCSPTATMQIDRQDPETP
jgi:hypothetical protein